MRRTVLFVAGAAAVVAVVAGAVGAFLATGPSGVRTVTDVSGLTRPAAPTQARWVIRDLGLLAGTWVGVSDRGEVVWQGADGHARLWESGRTIDLGTLGGKYSAPSAVNGRGQVVGWSATQPEGGNATWHAFLWENGRMRDLGTLGGRASYATATNDRGVVVGWAETDRRENSSENLATPGDTHRYTVHGGTRHAFMWRDGKMRDLGTLPDGEQSYAWAINPSGLVVGQSQRDFDGDSGFVWQNGRLLGLGGLGCEMGSEVSAINASGEVVGESCDKDGQPSAFLWQNGRIRSLPLEWADRINNRGQVLGGETLLENGQAIPLGFYAVDLNERGQVVGGVEEPREHAMVWHSGTTTDLGTLPGGSKSYASAINNKGQIVGWATTKNGQKHAVLWTLRSG